MMDMDEAYREVAKQDRLIEDRLEKAVVEAAEALDLHYPNWPHAIDGLDLRMDDTRFCILGQLGEERGYSYGEMMGQLRDLVDEDRMDRIGVAFDLSDHLQDYSEDPWWLLGNFWQRQIRQRVLD